MGNGQIWDIRGIDPKVHEKIFEDLFSGRSLAERAYIFDERYAKKNRGKRIFINYLEEGKDNPTGLSVTFALLKGNSEAKSAAKFILRQMGEDGGRGIETLIKGTAYKESWTEKERNYWKGLEAMIIGGGVSEGKTGEVLIQGMRRYLDKRSLSHLNLHQARFPGKEAGFIGAVANIIDNILKEKFPTGTEEVGVIGIDLGRDKIGMGLLRINPKTGGAIKTKEKIWTYSYSIKMPYREKLNTFKDSYREYTSQEKKLGEKIRDEIICQIVNLIINALRFAARQNLILSRHIGIGSPGETSASGYLVGSTHYLPLFQKKDGFWFKREVEEKLERRGYRGFEVHIVNDGIAAGLANLRFGLDFFRLKKGKYGFLGPGSGLGGFVAEVKKRDL